MGTYTPNLNLYKPDASDPFGEFREKFNDNMDILDNGGGGGSGGHTIYDKDGNALAQESGLQFTGSVNVTDDNVNGRTVVDILGGGGANYGFAIDENNKLFEGTINDFNQSLSYTATEDGIALCWYKGSSGTWQFLSVNGTFIRLGGNGTDQPVSYSVPIRKGDTVSARYQSGSESCYFWLSVYGIKQGTNGIFTPVIYSDTERKIGIWRDNKPLYQRTIEITQIPNQDTKTIAHGIANIDRIVDINGICYARTDVDPNYASTPLPRIQDNSTSANMGVDANRTNIVLKGRGTDFSSIYATVTVTLQYTKTTDVAGSGNWNTDGVPTVHYDNTEKVIGTYLGKPLYQITYSGLSLVCTNANQSYATNEDWGNIKKIVHSDIIDQYGQSCAGSVVYTGTPAKLAVYMQMPNRTVTDITIQYTKTTD